MDLDFYQIDVVLLLLGKAVLEGSVVIRVHLIAFQVDLERCALFNPLVPNVVEPLVPNQLNSRGSEVRVEL